MAACASGPADKAGLRPSLPADANPDFNRNVNVSQKSLYGLFLAGQAALDKGSSRDAAVYLGRAADLAPDAGFLRERAFTAALIAGDIQRAADLAPEEGQGTASSYRLGLLTRAIDAMADKRGKEAAAILVDAPTQGPTGSAINLLRPWAAAMSGDWETATAPPTGDADLTKLFGGLSQAKLLERARRYSEADAAYSALNKASDSSLFALAYGGFLERRGRRQEAMAVYEKLIRANGDASVLRARERLSRRQKAPPLGSLQEAAAETLLGPAALQMTRQQPETALALLRMALRLDPKLGAAWLLVGDSMSAAGDEASAREAYASVAATSNDYDTAQGRLAWSLQRGGDPDAALQLARANLQRSGDSAQALSVYADLLRENARFDETITVMDRLIAKGGEQADAWRLYFFRGMALERSGRWSGAEADLTKSLSLRPDEPEVMNYLAYGWADRGEKLTEALAMLEKAAAMRPRSGEIRDSLGWARFRAGRYAEALTDLERAVSLAPADPSINDHLGDVYLKVGRKLEAEYQWRRVLTLDPDEDLRQAVEAKLESLRPRLPPTVASAGQWR